MLMQLFDSLGQGEYSLYYRMFFSFFIALVFSLACGSFAIKKLQLMHFGQVVRNDGPESHFSKNGTPTMGGILIILAITLGVLLCGDLSNVYLWIILFTLISHALIGFADDYLKVVRKNPKGLIPRWKYFWQSVCAIAIGIALYMVAKDASETSIVFPFISDYFDLGPLFIVFVYFVIVGSSNAVNLTDGLDGLAIICTMLVGGALGLIALLTSDVTIANNLNIPYLAHAKEVGVVATAIAGSALGFLWFNCFPAKVFMGDVGSLALGALLGIMAVVIRQEILLFIMGGIFVLETISVILQVGSYKLRKKRIFLMAPIHHHFEKLGWPEPRVCIRFCIITAILVSLGLLTLLCR